MSPIVRACVAPLLTISLGTFAACGGDDEPSKSSKASPSESALSTSPSIADAEPVDATTETTVVEVPAYTCDRLYVSTDYLNELITFWGRESVSVAEIDQARENVEALVEIAGSADPSIATPLTVMTTESTNFLDALVAPGFDGYPIPPFRRAGNELSDVCLAVMEEQQWHFNAKDYGKYRDVVTILHEAGFDEYLERAQNVVGPVRDSCESISREPEGGAAFRSDRRSWIDALTESGTDEWGWNEKRANKFVDVLFAACFDTGNSKRYVPTITNGIWTVGRDIPPGAYRSSGVTSSCYWAIYSSGSNGNDIIANDLPSGGYPTVTLSVGQDFDTTGCGIWKKIG